MYEVEEEELIKREQQRRNAFSSLTSAEPINFFKYIWYSIPMGLQYVELYLACNTAYEKDWCGEKLHRSRKGSNGRGCRVITP